MRPILIVTLALTLAAIVALAAPSPTENLGTLNPKAPEETKQLAFLIGEWSLDTWFLQQEGNRSETSASLTVRYTLDGFGVELRARYPSETEGEPDFLSTTTWVFHTEQKRWIGTGINTLGNAKRYQATWEGDRFVVIQSGTLFGGRPGINRLTYYDIKRDSYKLRHEHSPNDGKTWQQPAFGYTARRLR